jgi:methylthioribulose-1-phosphate dehydratase
VPATSGNLSARLGPHRMTITASGRHKGKLQPTDFLDADLNGTVADGRRPSAETGLHCLLYRRSATCRAVLHIYSPASTLVGLDALPIGEVVWSGLELLKAFPGVSTHAVTRRLPVVANDQNIDRLARTVAPLLDGPDVLPGFVIAGHGLTAWGDSIAAAWRHLEALEFLLHLRLHRSAP